MAKKESKSSFERDYTIPLRDGIRKAVTYKKAERTVRDIQAFLTRHTKAKTIKLGMHLNEYLWKNGMRNPPPRVKVHVVVKDDVATAELFGKDLKQAAKAEKKKDPSNLKEKIEAKLGADKAEESEEVKEQQNHRGSESERHESSGTPKKKPAKK